MGHQMTNQTLDGFKFAVASLATRHKKLIRVLRPLGLLNIVVLVVRIIVFTLAYTYSGDFIKPDIDIPEYILNQINDSDGGLDNISRSFDTLSDKFVELIPTLFNIIAVASFAISIFLFFVHGMQYLILSIFIPLVFITSSGFVRSVLPIENGNTTISAQEDFINIVKDNDINKVNTRLKELDPDMKLLNSIPAQYLITQMEVTADDYKSGSISSERVKKLAAPQSNYKPDAKILYFIERTVLGDAFSEIAISAKEQKLKKIKILNLALVGIGIFSALSAAAFLIVFYVKNNIGKRLVRINQLTNIS